MSEDLQKQAESLLKQAGPNTVVDELGLLPTSDGHHNRADARMIVRAVRNRWNTTDEVKKSVIEAAMRILNKGYKTIAVKTQEGVEAMQVDNQMEQMAAAKVIVAIEAQNQADEHLEEKYKRIDDGKGTESTIIKPSIDYSKYTVEELEQLEKLAAKAENVLPAGNNITI